MVSSLETVEKFCCLGNTIGTIGDAVDSVMIRIRNRWNKFRDLEPLLVHYAIWK